MKKVGLYIDERIWQAFRIECVRRNVSSSQEITRLITEQLDKWQVEQQQEKRDDPHRKS